MELLNPAWSDQQLDDSILLLCDEFPDASMAAYSRALEHCRQNVSQGAPDALLTAMRGRLEQDPEAQRPRRSEAKRGATSGPTASE